MPQMSPLMWVALFLFFSSALFIITMKSYFNFSPEPSAPTINMITCDMINYHWLW